MDGIERALLTPLMQQYYDIKINYADALLFFQVGDFYELFFDDAQKAAAFLVIALTKRGTYKGEPIPLCGVPVHAYEHYAAKLVRGGFKVAVCNQLEEARPGAIVRRGVVQVLTPGTITDTRLLDAKTASHIFSFFPTNQAWAIVCAELMSARLFATMLPAGAEKVLESELVRFLPNEIILPEQAVKFGSFFKQRGYFASFVDKRLTAQFPEPALDDWLSRAFVRDEVAHITAQDALRYAFYFFYVYLRRTQEAALDQFHEVHFYKPDDFLVLDATTVRTLELIENNTDASSKHTLFGVLDGAITPMGSRCIKKWILSPLVDKQALEQRHDVVQTCVEHVVLRQSLEKLFVQVHDFERLLGKIALNKAGVNDYRDLIVALGAINGVRVAIEPFFHVPLLHRLGECLADFGRVCSFLNTAINDNQDTDWIIKKGFDEQLDQMRELAEHAHEHLLALERAEQERCGIPTLKIRYNQVAGYYFEVTKTHAHKIPDNYERLQTLSGKERFVSPELHELERKITQATREITMREKELFDSVRTHVLQEISGMRRAAQALACLDALLGFARVAYYHRYVRPVVHDSRDVSIVAGRHPVVECTVDHAFIPNDLILNDEQALLIITGPNMGGKSTFLRQTALIGIMAQAGSFVPATSAFLPIFDRIFTRIGAGDNLAAGKSTFLVEMEETASICRAATERSLVILDEVGRGTSTFDGLAIAHAVVEHVLRVLKARCLFATHYHELTRLEQELPGVASFYAASKKDAQGIVFLYTMVRGVADGSYGLEVAKLAQLPTSIVVRARQVLHELTVAGHAAHQMSIVPSRIGQDVSALRQEIARLEQELARCKNVAKLFAEVDCNELSPRQALELVWKLKQHET